jgi:hypothetical protein
VDPSANVSVKQALKTRGDDADKVIIKELTQMEAEGLGGCEGTRHVSCRESRCDTLLHFP